MERGRRAKPGAEEAFWAYVSETGAPLVEPDPEGEEDHRLVTFVRREDPARPATHVLALVHTVTDKDRHAGDLAPHLMGDAARFLLENTSVQVSFHEGEPLFAELPVSVDLTVSQTDPGLQGDRSTGGTKPATLETGAEVQVPLFIETGDVLKIDTRDGSYLSRVNN